MPLRWLIINTGQQLKILFVLSGNNTSGTAAPDDMTKPVKHAVMQGDSLRNEGLDVEYYYITGKGFWGYLKNIPPLRRYIRRGGFDIIHAHYSLTAIATSLAGSRRMVVSLMGSDLLGNSLLLPLLRFFCRYRWKLVIVKTEEMKARLGQSNVTVLPNGVDTDLFRPLDRGEARRQLGLPDKKIILFAADPARPEKNFKLASDSVSRMNRDDALLLPVGNADRSMMPMYYSAANVLLLTSLWEGSVNSVKEAMACNLAVVSCDVGDVRSNTRELEGYHITSYDPDEIAAILSEALDQKTEPKGRERIFELKLDAKSVSRRLVELYTMALTGQRTVQ